MTKIKVTSKPRHFFKITLDSPIKPPVTSKTISKIKPITVSTN